MGWQPTRAVSIVMPGSSTRMARACANAAGEMVCELDANGATARYSLCSTASPLVDCDSIAARRRALKRLRGKCDTPLGIGRLAEVQAPAVIDVQCSHYSRCEPKQRNPIRVLPRPREE